MGGANAVAQRAPQPVAKAPLAPLSEKLTVTVDGNARTFSVAELEAMPQKTLAVHNEHSRKDESYTGVLLTDLLAKCGMVFSKDTQKKFLHSTLRMTGTDQYFVIYSAAEVSGDLHMGDVIVATRLNGGSLGIDGKIRVVSSEDKKPARWVRNLVSIAMVEQL
jgi:hypothetical protein